MDNERIAALAAFLGCEADDISGTAYFENELTYGRCEYLVLTDDEADEAAEEYIRDSLWAFNPDFICRYMPDGLTAEDVKNIVGDRCEDANSAMLALVNAGTGLKQLVDDAIAADGRGHFLSGYDGEENESGDYFIYRTN